MSLVTEGELEKYLLQDIDSSYSTFVSTVISIVEDYIEKYTGIDFENTTAGDRYFDGSGNDELTVDEFRSPTALIIYDIDGNQLFSLTENTDYYTYPLNDTQKNTIKLRKSSGKTTYFPAYDRAVKLSATFGFATVPNPIKLVALKLAGKILEKGLKGGEASAESLGEYSIDYKEINEHAESLGVFDILNQYRHVRL